MPISSDPIKRAKQIAQLRPHNRGEGVNGPPHRGKMMSTWLREFASMPADKIPQRGTPEYDALPLAAKTALSRWRVSQDDKSNNANRAAEIIMDRTEGPLKTGFGDLTQNNLYLQFIAARNGMPPPSPQAAIDTDKANGQDNPS